MQDGIINETGNSRYLRTVAGIRQLAPTYDAFLELLIRGELPVDLNGINADGWAQVGTALNKSNLLTDATAALADLGPEATLNEMLAALANQINSIGNQKDAVEELQKRIAALITSGTTDLAAGSSPLTTGTVYLVYE